jgi:hypothetical protein
MLNMGILFIVWIAILWITKTANPTDAGSQGIFFFVGGLVTLLKYCELAGRKMHQHKGFFFTIPASNEEKYIALLLEGVIYFLSFQVIFWVGIFIWKLFGTNLVLVTFTEVISKSGLLGLVFFSSLLFLSYVSFPKHAFLVYIGGLAVYSVLTTWIGGSVLTNALDDDTIFSSIYDMGFFIGSFVAYACVVATLVVLYVAYLKLKEKEQR